MIPVPHHTPGPIRRSLVAVVAAGLLAFGGSSCQLMTSAEISDARGEAREEGRPARIAEDRLEEVGLEEAWYLPSGLVDDPRDGGVQAAYLIPDGLIIVTLPTEAGGERLIKLIDRETGEPKWWEPVDGPITSAPFAYHYPGDANAPELLYHVYDTIYCLDLRYGARLWSQSVEPPISSRVIANDTHVFFGSGNGRFYAFRKGEAYEAWQYRTGGEIDSAPALFPARVGFASHDGTVYGLTPDQGYVSFDSWTTDTGARVVADVTAYSRWFFVGSTDYKLYCIESSDGTTFWSFGAEAPILDRPVVYRWKPNQEFVFVVGSEGPSDRPKRTLFCVPVPRTGLAPAGRASWRREDVRRVLSIGDERLYVLNDPAADGERSLSALDVTSGEEDFRLSVEGFHFVPTNDADAGRETSERGKLYLVTRDGAVQAIRESP